MAERVYQLSSESNDYAALQTVLDADLDYLVEVFDGKPIGPRWRPVPMFWETEGRRPIPDFDKLASGGMAFSERGVGALRGFLERAGELLPLEVEGGNSYRAFNLTRWSEALDYERSELKRFSDGGIMRVVRYEFDPAKVARETIFRIADVGVWHTFVTEEFVRVVQKHELTSFHFDLVWSESR